MVIFSNKYGRDKHFWNIYSYGCIAEVIQDSIWYLYNIMKNNAELDNLSKKILALYDKGTYHNNNI